MVNDQLDKFYFLSPDSSPYKCVHCMTPRGLSADFSGGMLKAAMDDVYWTIVSDVGGCLNVDGVQCADTACRRQKQTKA